MLFEEPVPHLSGEKWGRSPKRTDESAHEDVLLGTACSRFYDFGRNKMEILKIMTNQCTWETENASDLCTGRR